MPFFFRGETLKYLIQTVTIKVSPIRFRLISDVDKTFITPESGTAWLCD